FRRGANSTAEGAMFIIGDENSKYSRIPWVTGGLILANLMVFGLQNLVGEPLTYGFALVPAEIAQGKDLTKPQKVKMDVLVPGDARRGSPHIEKRWVDVPQYPGPFPIVLTLFTSMFLHGGWAHLISNMW